VSSAFFRVSSAPSPSVEVVIKIVHFSKNNSKETSMKYTRQSWDAKRIQNIYI
jgi:hypothetical protein